MWLLLPLPFRGHEATDEAGDTWGRKLSEGVLEAGAEGGPLVERELWAQGLQWLNRPRCLGCQWGGPRGHLCLSYLPLKGRGPRTSLRLVTVSELTCLYTRSCAWHRLDAQVSSPTHLTCQEG